MKSCPSIWKLEESLDYKFNDINLLNRALCHASFANEQVCKLESNERLEFLGDAVLNLVISDLFVKRYPDLDEGRLSKLRSNFVNEDQLAFVASSFDLGNYLYLGKGEEKTGGREKVSILANTMEAIIAAIYLDGGIKSSFAVVKKLFIGKMIFRNCGASNRDYKSKLQELTQHLYQKVPCYHVVSELGPEHDKKFEVKMSVGTIASYGKGNSKKSAEQFAAKKGLELLKG